jgi:hypothetical protein
MDIKTLQAKISSLEKKIAVIETELTAVHDIQEIEKLQRTYGYYLDNRLWDDVVDLFSDKTESLEISDSGVYLGKAGVERFFKGFLSGGGLPPGRGSLGTHMQLQGVVNLDPGGTTARGRWQCVILLSVPYNSQLTAMVGFGVYETEYIKENGIWAFKKMHFYLIFRTPLHEGWAKTPVVYSMAKGTPDKPATIYKPLPERYIVPFHYKNPVTGKEPRIPA